MQLKYLFLWGCISLYIRSLGPRQVYSPIGELFGQKAHHQTSSNVELNNIPFTYGSYVKYREKRLTSSA